MHLKLMAICTILLFLSCPVRAQNTKKVYAITEQTTSVGMVSLTPYLYYNQSTTLFVDTVNQLPVNKKHTFHFYIKNSTGQGINRVISFGKNYVTANKVIIESKDDDNTYNTEREISDRSNTIKLSLAPNQIKRVTFSLKELNRNDPQKASVNLLTVNYAVRDTQTTYITQAFFLGLFAFLCVFNLIIYLVTRWRVYAKYALYIFFALLYFAYYHGILQKVFPGIHTVSNNLIYIWYSLIFISYFYFINDFGDYKKHVPRAHKLLNIGVYFKLMQTTFDSLMHVLGADFIYLSVYKYLIMGFEIILMGAIITYIVRNRDIRGRLVILASLLLIVGGILDQLVFMKNFDHSYFIEVAVAAELLVFSVGLGYTTKLHYRDKRKSQQLYIEELQKNEKIQRDINQLLEEKVKQRTLDLEKEKQQVEKKNKENELLLSEVYHRVKNNLQTISSLLNMQERSIKDKVVKDAITSGKERIKSMELVHKMLYNGQGFKGIEMKGYIHNLFHALVESYVIKKDKVVLKSTFDPVTLDADTAIPIGLILNELITNSFKHGRIKNEEKLTIKVLIKEQNDTLLLHYNDNGNGTPESIMNKKSFGYKIIESLVKQQQGHIILKNGKGLSYQIRFHQYRIVQ